MSTRHLLGLNSCCPDKRRVRDLSGDPIDGRCCHAVVAKGWIKCATGCETCHTGHTVALTGYKDLSITLDGDGVCRGIGEG